MSRARRPPTLTGEGWQPSPIRQFVLKIHSRCNLACDYCYVYTMADQTWRAQPQVMSLDTVRRAARRIGEHAERHSLARVGVVLHGGEPLLAGHAFIADAVGVLRRTMPADTTVAVTVQTNGVLLTRAMLDTLNAHSVSVSVSIDGGPADHDRHRRYPNGRGSFADAARGLDRLRSAVYQHLFAGLLCTVDLTHDPVRSYEALLQFQPPRADFLFPLGNWSTPPPGRPADPTRTPYADWLGAVFDRWYTAPRPETELRLFREIIHLLLGGVSYYEGLGLAPVAIAVIETDGSLEQVDAMKSAFPGAAATGLHVSAHSMDDLLRHPAVLARQAGLAALSEECRRCPVRHVCGGGFYPHRYRAGAGFRNRSVYCPDLFALIHRIRARIDQDIDRFAAVR